MVSVANGVNIPVGQPAPGHVTAVKNCVIGIILARLRVRNPNKTYNLAEVLRVMDHGVFGVRALSHVDMVFKQGKGQVPAETETKSR